MLKLKRKPGETIIAGETRITVVRASRGSVVLAIDAPESVRIRREEIPQHDEQKKRIRKNS